jgi:DNA-binding transcriptional MerR regulator
MGNSVERGSVIGPVVGTTEAARLVGINRRTLDFWIRSGVFAPAVESDGPGYDRAYDEWIIVKLFILAQASKTFHCLATMKTIWAGIPESGIAEIPLSDLVSCYVNVDAAKEHVRGRLSGLTLRRKLRLPKEAAVPIPKRKLRLRRELPTSTRLGTHVEHGQPKAYNMYKCRCDACRAAWTAYLRSRRKT